MSLVQKISSRHPSDLLNDGLQYAAAGSSGGVTDLVVVPIAANRAPVVMGFTLTSTSATPVAVSLGFKKGSDVTMTFFQGQVTSSSPLMVQYGCNSWYRGDLGYSVVLTSAGAVTYSVDAKITSFPAALGYVEREGSQNPNSHMGRAWLPPDSGADRGQSEL